MKALFRCDATADIGFGHLIRCIALAEALRMQGVRSVFAGQFDAGAKDQIDAAGFDSVTLDQPINTGADERDLVETADFVVLDSYRADPAYLAVIKPHGPKLVMIDDFRELESYPCDVVLNFTWEAPSLGYPEGPALLLGPEYFLTRRKLVERRADSIQRHRSGDVRNLLVAVGGSDPKGITARLLRLLSDIDSNLCVHTISGSGDPLEPLLERFAPGSEVLPRQPDLSQPLLWADAAITGGGLIKYESAFMAVPAAAIAQNEGQDGETQVFAGAGLVFDLGLADTVSDEELAASLKKFLSSAQLRENLTTRMKKAFVADPTANAAQSILEALSK